MREWLHIKRVEKEMSHKETADAAGISRSYYTQVERGFKTPSVKVAKAIGKALNFDWTMFFEDGE